MKAYINLNAIRADGTVESLDSTPVECKIEPLWWQTQGLSFTATGYGSRIPTQYMVKVMGKWRRVYCRCNSNVGTTFIGRGVSRHLVDMDEDHHEAV